MTMHLLPAYYTTTKSSSRSKSKPKTTAQIKHEKWLAKQGLSSETIRNKKVVDKSWMKEYTNSMRVNRDDYNSMGISGSKDACAKRGVMENLHKEPEHVRNEILYKASRVMPLYNKGGLQYATPEEDMTKVGTKSRR